MIVFSNKINKQTAFIFCRLFIFLYLVFVISSLCSAESLCVKYEDCGGSGKYPFNYREIDGILFVGGSLFNPANKESNSITKVRQFLEFLKNKGVKSIISLNYSEKDGKLKILSELCKQSNLEHLKVKMNAELVPNNEQTKIILDKIMKGAYVHCLWGCDRTGAIIAKYLTVKCDYSGEAALNAVIKYGSHSGMRGGFKQRKGNNLLIKYFWPDGIQYK